MGKTENLITQLWKLVNQDDVYTVELVMSNLNPKEKILLLWKMNKHYRTTFLHIAAKKKSLEMIACLIRHGFNYNIGDIYGRAPSDYFPFIKLMQFICENKLRAAQNLIKLGYANVNQCDKNGTTALMCAAEEGDLVIVENLLKLEADVNIQDNLGRTALMLAAANGHLEIIKLLLSIPSTNVNIQDKKNKGVLYYAIHTPGNSSRSPNYLKIINVLSEAIQSSTPRRFSRDALDSATQMQYLV